MSTRWRLPALCSRPKPVAACSDAEVSANLLAATAPNAYVRDVGSPLISVAELAADLAAFTILDVRYKLGGPPGPAEFAAGHIPGAVYVDLDRELAAPAGKGGRHPLPDTTVFASAMRNAGVSNARPVVADDDWGARAAGSLWWLLRYYGHVNVRVLDGGWPAWRAAGQPVSTAAAMPSIGDF